MRPISPSLVTIPSSDLAFRHVVDRVAESTGDVSAVEARLRFLYPRATVRARQLSSEPRVLYVYRDGRFEPDRSETWWTAPGVARVRIALATGELVAANEAWHAAMEAPPGGTLGRSYLDFILPEARSDARAIFEAIAAEGAVTSAVLMRRPDGSRFLLDFHAELDGDAVEVAYRPSTR